MDILLTFVGFHDPYAKGLLADAEQAGPILSLLEVGRFDQVILFSTPNTLNQTDAAAKVISRLHPAMDVMQRHLDLSDPTNYEEILRGLRWHLQEIQEQSPGAKFSIGVNSGTPQMHASWLLLAASGEIPARLLSVRPPRFVERGSPLLTEIDTTSSAFPIVRALPREPLALAATPDLSTAMRQLGIIADHPSMSRPLDTVAGLAASNVPILIIGETGTGKELFARLVHLLSGRPREKFVPLNCAAIPETLVESLLFGHKKGAFTGAIADQLGKFDLADGGTLFLDELGELPASAQAKLLRVVQDGLVEPIGARRSHGVDVRLVCATNRDIRRLVKKGAFREDLYYRLEVGQIELPPLRERPSDIPKIALHVLDQVNRTLRYPRRLSQAALQRLQVHSWPGNIRDLQNVIERSVRLARTEVLDATDLLISEPVVGDDPLGALPEPRQGFSLEGFLQGARRQLILQALKTADGNQSEAARLLGITPQAVHKFLRTSDGGFNRG